MFENFYDFTLFNQDPYDDYFIFSKSSSSFFVVTAIISVDCNPFKTEDADVNVECGKKKTIKT